MNKIIELINVTKEYKIGNTKIHALKSINFCITKGESITFMGPSGSGKSTLLHIIGCLDKQTTGKVKIMNRDIGTFNDKELTNFRKNQIGFIFQFFNLIPVLNVAENVVVSRMYERDKFVDRVFELLHLVGLGHRLDHLPGELSGGERQRLAIARALINNPPILIADEPTGNLDEKTSNEILQLFIKLNELGTTIIIATHDPLVWRFAKKRISIYDGKIIV